MKEIHTDNEFAELYEKSKTPIILDFYTETCNPCKSLMPILDKLAFEFGNKIQFLKTRADKNVILARQLGITSVPTLIFVSQNKEIERANGLITENALRVKLNELIQ